MPSRQSRWTAVLVPAFLAVVVGLPAVDGTFVRDDWLYIPLNPHVTGDVSLATMFRSKFQPEMDLGLYRPLTTLAFAADWRAVGETPRRYHLMNLAWNAVAAAALAALLLAVGVGPLASGIAAAWFAVHAGRSEAVLWITGRSELMMGALTILALLAIRAGGGAWRWPVAGLLGVAAFLSKEQGLVLAILAPLLPGLARRERLLAAAWCGFPLIVALVVRAYFLKGLGPSGEMQVFADVGLWDRMLLGLQFLAQYARLAVWPGTLINEYDDPTPPANLGAVMIGAALLAAPLIPLLLRRSRCFFGACLALGPLVPVLNVLYRTGESFAERFLALPIAGVVWLAALALDRLAARKAVLALGLGILVAAPLASRFVIRAADWRSQDILIAAQTRDAPDLGGTHLLSAACLLDQFGLNEPTAAAVARAADELAQAVVLAPQRVEALMMLGRARLRAAAVAGNDDPRRAVDLQEAERLFRQALAVSPDRVQVRGTLGLTLAIAGRRAEAVPLLREELARNPHEFRAAMNLASILDDQGETAEARLVRQRALADSIAYAANDPADASPWRVAAQLALDLGDPPRAVTLTRRALSIPADPSTRAATVIEAAATYQRAGLRPEAQRLLEDTRAELETALAASGGTSVRHVLALADLDVALSDAPRARARLEAARAFAHGLELRKVESRLERLKHG